MERADLALGVSIFSLAVSIMAWRTAVAERPLAWIKLEPIGKADNCWLATVHLRNRSKFDLRAESLGVLIRVGSTMLRTSARPSASVWPTVKAEDFWLREISREPTRDEAAKPIDLEKDFLPNCLKVVFERGAIVRPGDTGVFRVLLVRSSKSAKPFVKMTFSMEVMKPRPRFKTVSMRCQIPTETLRHYWS
jgi:hypothetical protein